MNIMCRAKDFYLMEVKDTQGKKLGFIKDVDINFNKECLVGFILSSYNILKKEVEVLIDDIIIFNDIMIVKKITKKHSLEFGSIKGIDVIGKNNNILGRVEEIVFDTKNFKIQGLIVSSGFIKNFTTGKRILLLNNLILGESSILCVHEDKKIEFFSRPHNIVMEEEAHEEMV